MARHGETDWNRLGKTQGTQNTSLTDLGRYQANQLGNKLKNKPISAIYSSDLDRARETAQIVGKQVGLEPITCELIREVCFGNWQGLSIEEIENKYPGELSKWRNELSFYPQGGESLSSVHSRIKTFLNILKTNHPSSDETILIISHAATIKVSILEILGIPPNFLTKLKASHAGLSLLKMEEGDNAILYMNDTCHLDMET